MTADYKALSIVICQKFERMSKVASIGNYSLSPPRTGLRIAFPCFIPMHIGEQFGNNSGTDMLAQYGDFGT
jgi:hypothetical protein